MGPLSGFRIVEIAGIGPSQFCGMLLADMGADVVRIVRVGDEDELGIPPQFNVMNRGRDAIAANLKEPTGQALVLALCRKADALFEGFRPGVMERLGLGPEECHAVNKRLAYGRMTGWGQQGPLSDSAGHDANYSALAGVIGAIGEKNGPPTIPLNLAADFGGGGAYLAMGLLAAMLEAARSGKGQVVDAAMVDGAASLMTAIYGLHAGGLWNDERGSNLLDGGAPFYRVYRTSDDRHVVVAALEPRFYRELLDRLEIDDIEPGRQFDASTWPATTERFADVLGSRSRDQWCSVFEGSDSCFAPVLSLAEAPQHPHNLARDTFVDIDGIVQPGPAPRFSRTPGEVTKGPSSEAVPASEVLARWGLDS